MGDIRFGPKDRALTTAEIVSRAKQILGKDMDQQETFNWMAAELTRLRTALAASTAREAVMLNALRQARDAVKDKRDEARSRGPDALLHWGAILAETDHALRTPSPGAEKLLAVVMAARKESARHAHYPREYHSDVQNDPCSCIICVSVRALDPQEPEHG